MGALGKIGNIGKFVCSIWLSETLNCFLVNFRLLGLEQYRGFHMLLFIIFDFFCKIYWNNFLLHTWKTTHFVCGLITSVELVCMQMIWPISEPCIKSERCWLQINEPTLVYICLNSLASCMQSILPNEQNHLLPFVLLSYCFIKSIISICSITIWLLTCEDE